MNKIIAWINLAYRFALHVSWRLPRRALGFRGDYDRFLNTVSTEGYLPLNTNERAAFPEFMQCIHCGLCTLACPALRAAPASAWQEAWTFVGGISRSLERSALAAAPPAPCRQCGECEAACPTGVPIALLAATIERLATQQNARP